MDTFVEVYFASDITLAYLLKAQLEAAGIPVQIANENVSAVYSLDGMAPRVLVPQSRLQEAQEVIAENQRAVPNDVDALDGYLDEDDELDDEDGL